MTGPLFTSPQQSVAAAEESDVGGSFVQVSTIVQLHRRRLDEEDKICYSVFVSGKSFQPVAFIICHSNYSRL
jgi:hypothetical protein